MKKIIVSMIKAIGFFVFCYGVQSLLYLFGYLLIDCIMGDVTEQGKLYCNIASRICSVLCLVVLLKLRKCNLRRELSLWKIPPNTVCSALFMGIGYSALISVVLGSIPFPEKWRTSQVPTVAEEGDVGFLAAIFLSVIVAPIAEELVYRALVYGNMRKGMAMLPAMMLSSALFGIAHGTGIQFLHAFLAGVILVWILERTKSIWGSILFHGAFNLGKTILSEMIEGSEEWIFVALVVGTAVAIVATILFVRTPVAVVTEEVQYGEL